MGEKWVYVYDIDIYVLLVQVLKCCVGKCKET